MVKLQNVLKHNRLTGTIVEVDGSAALVEFKGSTVRSVQPAGLPHLRTHWCFLEDEDGKPIRTWRDLTSALERLSGEPVAEPSLAQRLCDMATIWHKRYRQICTDAEAPGGTPAPGGAA